MPFATLVAIDGIVLGDYAARGLSMQLTPIDAGTVEYDINGALHDLTLTQFRKYQVTISCTDHEAPKLNDVWRGKQVTITCLPQIGVDSQDTATGPLVLDAMVVSWRTTRDEWGASTGWEIEFLER